MISNTLKCVAVVALFSAGLVIAVPAQAAIVGVDFQTGTSGTGSFDATPDDLDLSDGITVSGWVLPGTGNPVGIVNDNGANGDVAYEGDLVGRYQQDRTAGYFSITIPNTVFLDLTEVTFAVRGATGSEGRDISFRTSLDGPTDWLYENLNLPGRNATPDWAGAPVPVIALTDAKYKGLTDTTVDFLFLTSGGIDIDAIVVDGTATEAPTGIPEPVSLAAGLFGLTLIAVRRRR